MSKWKIITCTARKSPIAIEHCGLFLPVSIHIHVYLHGLTIGGATSFQSEYCFRRALTHPRILTPRVAFPQLAAISLTLSGHPICPDDDPAYLIMDRNVVD